MRKILFTLVAAMLCIANASGQAFATLQHGENIKTFNGSYGLRLAMDEAQDGDIITLSAGTFDVSDITKAITLRGAGMQADEQGQITLISNGISPTMGIKIANGKEKTLTIEGICMPKGSIHGWQELGTCFINKCVINSFHPAEHIFNTVLSHCMIWGYEGSTDGSRWGVPQNGSVKYWNCFLARTEGISNSYYFDHCVINDWMGSLVYGNYDNCIIKFRAGNGEDKDKYHGYFNHCVTNREIPIKSGSYNIVVENINSLFANYDNSIASNTDTFFSVDLRLTDEAKTGYLGSDDTQVGVYGGTNPYSPYLDQPTIKKLTVAPRSSKEGKLSVDIEVNGIE